MPKKSYVNFLLIIVGTLLLISGAGFKGYHFWFAHNFKIRNSKEFLISGIFQTGPKKEAILTSKLAELVGLSKDKPVHIYDFDEKEAEKKLLSFPVFKEVKIQKKKPSSILIDYTIREPLAKVKDYLDIVIDEEGVLFPYTEFYTQKNIPDIFLGVMDATELNEKKTLSLKVLKIAQEMLKPVAFHVQLVDVSSAFIESFSKREVVLTIDQDSQGYKFPYLLRMNVLDLEKQLSNFLVLSKELIKQQKLWSKLNQSANPKPKVIDLRLDGMALIE